MDLIHLTPNSNGGLNKNVSNRLTYLNNCSPVGSAIKIGLGGMPFQEEVMSLKVSFKV